MNIKFMLVLKYINGSPADIINIHGILTEHILLSGRWARQIHQGTFLMKYNVLIMIKQLILVISIQ